MTQTNQQHKQSFRFFDIVDNVNAIVKQSIETAIANNRSNKKTHRQKPPLVSWMV